MKSISKRILEVFADGPGMSADIALELGIPPRKCSGTLNFLVKTRKLDRKPFHLPPELRVQGSPDVLFLYSLRSYDGVAA